jgi:hypothetical protein
MKNLLLVITFVLINIQAVNAAGLNAATILKCAKIQSDASRLNCFDKIANSIGKQKQGEILSSNTAPKVAHQKLTSTPLDAKVNQSLTQDNPQNSKSESLKDFGKKQPATPQSIASRLNGEFKKWSKGQKLFLENGQVWVVKRANRGYKKINHPMITITEDMFGGFTAKVEGLNATAKVRRIK